MAPIQKNDKIVQIVYSMGSTLVLVLPPLKHLSPYYSVGAAGFYTSPSNFIDSHG